MKNNPNNAFLRRTLSRLLPDAFFHPLWTHLIESDASDSHDFLRELLHDLDLEPVADDLVSNCQIAFLCAYLESRLGEHAAALARIEQIWKLSDTYALRQIACCAAWGAGAICVRQGNYHQAADWLNKLEGKLKQKEEWLLLDVLELFRQNLEAPVPDIDESSNWLLRWGEWHLSEALEQSEDIHRPRQVAFPAVGMLSRLIHRWNSFWNFVRYGHQGKPLPQQSILDAESIMKNENSQTELMPEAQSYGVVSKVLPSFPALLSQDRQKLTGISNRPEPHVFASATEHGGLRSLSVYCLGQFQAYQDEKLIENWLSRKALSIFKYLMFEHPGPVVKEVLMETFWPDSDIEAARRNLHQAIYVLRQILRGDQEEFHHIFFRNDCYSLNPGVELWIDYREFEKCIEAGRRFDTAGRPEEAMQQYEIAEGLYQGDFLEEDLYEDWPNLQRERLRNSYFSLVDRLTELYLQIGPYTSVIYLCHKVLVKDRCHEAFHRKLMQCFMAQGQRHLAVRQYQTCIRVLREDLGIQPSRETIDLYRRIAAKPGA